MSMWPQCPHSSCSSETYTIITWYVFLWPCQHTFTRACSAGYFLTLSHFLRLVCSQPCPATCTLSNLSCHWSSKRSWRQIPTLSEYYHLSAFHHHCAISESHMMIHRSDTVCSGQGAWKTKWAANTSVCSDWVGVGVWWERQLVIGWATGGGGGATDGYCTVVMYAHNVDPRCCQLIEARGSHVRVRPQRQTHCIRSWRTEVDSRSKNKLRAQTGLQPLWLSLFKHLRPDR